MSRLTYPHRPTAARAVKAPAAPTGFRVQLEIWIRHLNSGAADRALANARPVSPSASYLKGHQVTKCPCSWLGPTSSGSFTPATLRGPAAIRHPWRGAALAASMPLGPLHDACVQPAPKSRFVASELTRLEARSRSTANTAVCLDAIPVGDAGGHDGSEAVGQLQTQLSVLTQFLWETPEVTTAAIAVYQLQMSRLTYPYRPTEAWARTAPTGFGGAGNLDTPRDRGTADRALANARPVSPSALLEKTPSNQVS
jgi:hypothetical protein